MVFGPALLSTQVWAVWSNCSFHRSSSPHKCNAVSGGLLSKPTALENPSVYKTHICISGIVWKLGSLNRNYFYFAASCVHFNWKLQRALLACINRAMYVQWTWEVHFTNTPHLPLFSQTNAIGWVFSGSIPYLYRSFSNNIHSDIAMPTEKLSLRRMGIWEWKAHIYNSKAF